MIQDSRTRFKNTKYENFIVIEYEIYQLRDNGPIFYQYNQKYNTNLGVPLLIFNDQKQIVGDSPIINNIREQLGSMDSNPCLLLDSQKYFFELDLNDLPGKPKIWSKDTKVRW